MIGYMTTSDYGKYVVFTRILSYFSWGIVNILFILAIMLDKGEHVYRGVALIALFLVLFTSTFPYKKSSLASHIHYTKIVPSHHHRVIIGLLIIHGSIPLLLMMILKYLFGFTLIPYLYFIYPVMITGIYILSYHRNRAPQNVPSWIYGRLTDGLSTMMFGYAIYETLFSTP
jgi:archaellum biogenesis protein FlaJ (TadC family)